MNTNIKIILDKQDYVVCIKPSGIVSEDVPGGMPDLLKKELAFGGNIFVVHRLDKATAGLMVYAKTKDTAALLSKEIQEGRFYKEYLAVIHGCPAEKIGTFCDFLFHDIRTNKTYVVKTERKGAKEAVLDYEVLEQKEGLSLVRIILKTGRTHQIRVQFSSRKMPLYGDARYGAGEKAELALLSCRLKYLQEDVEISPECKMPWNCFFQGENI